MLYQRKHANAFHRDVLTAVVVVAATCLRNYDSNSGSERQKRHFFKFNDQNNIHFCMFITLFCKFLFRPCANTLWNDYRRVPGPSCSKATNRGLNFHPGFLFCCSKVFFLFYLGHPSHHTVDQENWSEFAFLAFISGFKFCTNPGLRLPSPEQPGPGCYPTIYYTNLAKWCWFAFF